MPEAADLASLCALVARLRAPDGCPWDRERTLSDLRSHLLEEAHEAAAAIDAADWPALAEELGDLLFEVAFLIRLGEEAGALRRDDVVAGVTAKMIGRHPHVFGDERLADARAVEAAWERRKAAAGGERSLLAGVAPSLPALLAAYKMTRKAAGVGFDWPDAGAVFTKLEEELGELRAALAREAGARPAAIAEEIGDLLFTVANLARHLDVDPEAALAAANAKFRRRFAAIEVRLADAGRSVADTPLAELDALWERVKADESG